MGKKEDQVRDGLLEHSDAVQRCVDLLRGTVEAYLAGDEAYRDRAQEVDRVESEADTVRKRAERVLFEGAFLPSHREDYFVLFERLDEVADKAEDAADHVVLTRPPVPDDLRDEVEAMAGRMDEMADVMGRTVEMLFEDTGQVEKLVAELKEFEEEADDAEFRVVQALFRKDLATADKILVRQMVEMVGDVTDEIDDVGEHIAVFLVKRRA